MRTPSGLSLAIVALVTGATVTACGNQTLGPEAGSVVSPSSSTPSSPESSGTAPSSSTTESAPSAATGARLATGAFTLHLPPHWLNGTGDAPAGVVAMGVRPGEDVVEQVTVQRATGTAPATSLRHDGATDVRTASSVQIDGRAAEHATGVGGSRGARTAMDRYTVTGGGTTWQVTFSLNRWAYRSDRERLIASVLASWTWR